MGNDTTLACSTPFSQGLAVAAKNVMSNCVEVWPQRQTAAAVANVVLF